MTSLLRCLLVAVGAAIGGVARYFLSDVVQQGLGAAFPYGTLGVNLAGCFLIGAFLTAFQSRLGAPPEVRIFIVVGVLGSFTTLSTFGYETLALLQEGQARLAFLNMAANMGLGLVAVALGRAAALGLSF